MGGLLVFAGSGHTRAGCCLGKMLGQTRGSQGAALGVVFGGETDIDLPAGHR